MPPSDETENIGSQSKQPGDAVTRVDQNWKRSLTESISSEAFSKWYQNRQFAKNIRNGTPYFNGPSSVKSPRRHSPSQLLQCQRKIVYNQLNAPEESANPEGIFWFGNRFEKDIIMPFLQDLIADSNTYVCNSLWVDFTINTERGELRIKGETDPVVVDAEAQPLLPLEIKTKRSIDGLTKPNRHHKAQIHAYMRGLTKKHDYEVTDAIVLYGSRTNLDVTSFHVEFDPIFWEEVVLEWAESHTSYRLSDDLPPADPEYAWECNVCSYRHRCGQSSEPYADISPYGLLPEYTGYPQEKVRKYLEAHDGAVLTPTLAQQYPELASQHPVAKWQCVSCDAQFLWDEPDWDGDQSAPPLCPKCANNGTPAPLRSPQPDEQYQPQEADQDE